MTLAEAIENLLVVASRANLPNAYALAAAAERARLEDMVPALIRELERTNRVRIEMQQLLAPGPGVEAHVLYSATLVALADLLATVALELTHGGPGGVRTGADVIRVPAIRHAWVERRSNPCTHWLTRMVRRGDQVVAVCLWCGEIA